jgi:hypothetical protein
MLRREPTEEKEEIQRIIDALDSLEWTKLVASQDLERQEES